MAEKNSMIVNDGEMDVPILETNFAKSFGAESSERRSRVKKGTTE